MAENTKKYLDLAGLQAYDKKLKAHIEDADTATLDSAKSDAQIKATAAQNAAKSYTDTEVAKANAAAAAAKTQADKGVSDAAAAKTQADKGVQDAATAQAAADAAQDAADAAQDAVDDLAALVGTLPTGAAVDTVVEYVDKKTFGIATEGAMTALSSRVKTIEDDYLTDVDKNELTSAIAAAKEEAIEAVLDGVTDDFDTLKEVAAWIQSDTTRAAELTTRVSTAEGKITAAEGKIKTLEGEMDTAQADIESLKTAIGDGGSVEDMIAEAVAAEESARKTAVAGVQAGVDTNAGDITALEGRMGTAEGKISALETASATYAKQVDLDAVEADVTTLENKVATLEGASHTHSNKEVIDGITATLVEQWSLAHTNNHTHSNKAALDSITAAKISAWDSSLQSAKDYADEKFVIANNVILNTEIDALFE